MDNEEVADDLARAGRDRHTQVSVPVDVDVGLRRCGVPPGENAARLAKTVLEKGLRFRGLMGYEGPVLLMPPGPEKEAAAAAAMSSLMATKACLARDGIAVQIAAWAEPEPTPYPAGFPPVSRRDRDPGRLVFANGHRLRQMLRRFQCRADRARHGHQQDRWRSHRRRCWAQSVELRTRSSQRQGCPGVAVLRLTAEHCIIDLQDPSAPVEVGDRIEIQAHYSDATVNLHDRIYGIRDGRVEEILRVEG
jgi:D-serine deaminase-like pyridoxal phosphate-dependent protein